MNKRTVWRELPGAAGFALIYAVLGTAGRQIDRTGGLDALESFRTFPVWFCAAAAFLAVWFSALRRCRGGRPGAPARRSAFALYWLVILCAWLPMFLIEYPGSFMYDTQRQVFQIAKGEYDAFHPLLHTLMLRLCLSAYALFQSFEKCCALCSAVQMLLLSLCFAAVCSTLGRMAGRAWARGACLFYALYPAHMAMACNYIKDVLFSGFFAVFLARLAYQAEEPEAAGSRWACVPCGVLCTLLRNNMIYALGAFLAVLLLCGRVRRLALPCALCFALSLSLNECMIRGLGAKRGSAVEMFPVPIQQLARARLNDPDAFSEADAALMDSAFVSGGWRNYEPTLADPVKSDIREEVFLREKGELAALWLRIGARAPKTFAEAFAAMALPSLYPYETYRVAQPYIETGLQPGVVCAPFGQPPMSQPARFAAARRWLDERIFATGADGIPVLRRILNCGAVYWLLLLLLLTVLRFGGRTLPVLLLPLLLYGTYLLGPVMQGRYLYPFVCVLPHFVFCAARAVRTGEKG